MKKNFTFKTVLSVLMIALAGASAFAQGLENVIVETYYVSDANDATDTDGGSLPAGSTTYRIYLDLLPGYEVQAVYGNAVHHLRIETSTFFFNNEDRGSVTGQGIGSQFLGDNTVALDSYLAMGGAASGHFGVLKTDDTNGSIVGGTNNDGGSASISGGLLVNTAAMPALTTADGLIAGTPDAVTTVGLNAGQLALFDDENSLTGLFSTNAGAWSVLTGVQGPTAANRVLVAQITTDGVLSFELNVQLGTPDGETVNYVASNPQAGEIERAFLNYPLVLEPANGMRINAQSIAPYNFPTCITRSGDLTLALESPEATSTVVTGEDQWYDFVANSQGVRIEVATSAFDAVIELQDAAGNTIATENAVSGVGGEILNFAGPLTIGNQYFIAVRNFNSALGTGAYTVCVQRLRAPSCATPGPLSVCNAFKATYTGANTYGFSFINTLSGVTTSVNTNGSTSVSLPGLIPGQSYGVSLSGTYNLQDAAGNLEPLTFTSTNACVLAISAHADLDLRVQDVCASGPRALNAVIGATSWLCGASYLEWEFTQTLPSPGFPILANGPANNRFISLSSVPGLTAGASYDVRVRPVYGTTAGSWGPDVQCLQIAGAAMELKAEETISRPETRSAIEETVNVSVYPNPSNGQIINLNLQNVVSDKVSVRILDNTGRAVYMNQFVSEGTMNKVIEFSQPLSAGVYFVEINVDGTTSFERLVVQK